MNPGFDGYVAFVVMPREKVTQSWMLATLWTLVIQLSLPRTTGSSGILYLGPMSLVVVVVLISGTSPKLRRRFKLLDRDGRGLAVNVFHRERHSPVMQIRNSGCFRAWEYARREPRTQSVPRQKAWGRVFKLVVPLESELLAPCGHN